MRVFDCFMRFSPTSVAWRPERGGWYAQCATSDAGTPNLHLALFSRARLATIHGCLAGSAMRAGLKQLLMSTAPLVVPRNPDAVSAALQVDGRASGPLICGNLREMAGWVGTDDTDFSGSIVLLEDARQVGIGQVDRNLTQLIRGGVLDRVAGIALGSFQGFAGYSDRGWTVVDVLRERLVGLGVPLLGGLDVGHDVVGEDGGPDQHPVTLGGAAVLDTDAGALTVSPCVE
jgi:muramoyltetrapeptide carboxypeptidase